jgi:hypothetical protein
MFKGSKSGKAGPNGTKGRLGPPKEADGLRAAFSELKTFWKDVGVEEGELGAWCGLTIDHVLHAAVDGRTIARLEAPLLVLLEVVLQDTLVPCLETVVVLRDEWALVFEKIEGIVAVLTSMRDHYAATVPALKLIAGLIMATCCTARMCGPFELFTLHLTEPEKSEYTRETRAALKSELIDRMIDLCLQISIEVLRLKLEFEKMDYPHAGAPVKLQLMAYAQSKVGDAAAGNGRWWMPKALR